MTDTLSSQQDRRPERIATWSAAGGLVVAVSIAAITGNLFLDQRAAGATTLGAVGLTVALAAPFLASLAARRVREVALRRAIWFASGVLALVLGGLTIFSGIGWFFAAAAVGLIAAWWLSRGDAGARGAARAIAVSAWLLLSLGGALAGLWLRETPMCWDAGAAAPGWVAAGTASACMSDIVDDRDGLLALTAVAVGFVGLALLTRGGRGIAGPTSTAASPVAAPADRASSIP